MSLFKLRPTKPRTLQHVTVACPECRESCTVSVPIGTTFRVAACDCHDNPYLKAVRMSERIDSLRTALDEAARKHGMRPSESPTPAPHASTHHTTRT